MTFRKLGLINAIVLLIIFFLGIDPWYEILLVVAQVVFVPIALDLIDKEEKQLPPYSTYFGFVSFVAVFILLVTDVTPFDPILVFFYFSFTIVVAFYGFTRFMNRGFEHVEEAMIDFGLMYLAIGGGWFLAFEMGIDTGFSPLLTWLTAIHFHYSAFLLPIFVGFLGRIYKNEIYKYVGIIILLSPIIVALGITFSPVMEVFSVVLYIVGIYGIIILSYQTVFHSRLQRLAVRLSLLTLGVTILFSLVYALGNLTNQWSLSIDFMLLFHGISNAIIFGLIGIVGWSLQVPLARYQPKVFPISKIRGKSRIGENFIMGKKDTQEVSGLVDDLSDYEPALQMDTLSSTIKDFYENTQNYRLVAQVKWKLWFLPFATVYRLISRFIQQLNLPLSREWMEMKGDIISIRDELDGRERTRAWVRKAKAETIFIALYSSHFQHDKRYMNIALPLPGSAMVGVLEAHQKGIDLQLTSKKISHSGSDSGIYLAGKQFLFKLPLEEDFHLREIEKGILKATHQMWIFAVPFLTINYHIYHHTKK